MQSKLCPALLIVVALFSAAARLPVSPCLVTGTPGPKPCAHGCCANMACCRTSQQRTGPASQPLAKAAPAQQMVATLAVTVATSPASPCLSEARFVLPPQERAHSAPQLAVLCTFLI